MSDEGLDGRQREVRLTPPPRVEPVGAKLGRRRRGPSAAGGTAAAIAPAQRRGRPRWVAPLAFGLLALIAALGVYLIWAQPLGEGPAPSRERVDSRAGASPAVDSRAGASPAPGDPPVVGEGRAPSRGRTGTSPAGDPRAGGSPNPASPRAPSGAEFGRAMAEGLAALDAGDFETARAAFARAATLDPVSPEPASGLARLEAAAGRIALEQRRARAASLVAAEAWREAAAEYRAALEVDPTLTFARRGLELAEARAALSERLDFHLGRPERLTADEVLSEVDRLLETARGVEEAGPRHAAQVAALEDLVVRVRQPVRVALLSDARTEVTVYQVGRLGAFDRRELELRPGTYTVVGSRAGYRDVRLQLKIEPGRAPEPLEIRCEEKI